MAKQVNNIAQGSRATDSDQGTLAARMPRNIIASDHRSEIRGYEPATVMMTLEPPVAISSLAWSPQILVPSGSFGPGPKRLMPGIRISTAVLQYLREREFDEENCLRVISEKQRLLKKLMLHLAENFPNVGDDPYVHQICSSHLNSFINEIREREGKVRVQGGVREKLAPRTIEKKIRFLIDFFSFCVHRLEACESNPSTTFLSTCKKLKKFAARTDRHYQVFTDEHLRRIFEAPNYLFIMREPDYFWCPLFAVHLGIRLGDIVQANVSDFRYDVYSDLWYFDIQNSYAKNNNSVRRLPIPQPLIDLGFIRYLNHVKELGGIKLFPHRNHDTATAQRDPSKRASARFAKLLDFIDIRHVDLVFHSFRHTVITALHDHGASLTDAMQICGHQAQDHAVRMGDMTKQQARSCHLSAYAHPGDPRMNVPDAIARLKGVLERCVRPPLDYGALRIAADIVLEHLRKSEGRFVAGWARQNKRHWTAQLSRLQVAATPTGQLPGPSAVPPTTSSHRALE